MSTATKHETNESTEAFLSGKLAQVDIARIEKELKSLWQSASESGEGQNSVTRACAINLILYSEDSDAETVASDVLDDITTRHPCRAILAISRDSATRSLEAWVSARCHITDSKTNKQICCEQITVRSEGNGSAELASVVSPLIISDLPVFLWWRAKSVSLAKVKPFLSTVDELIVDSMKDEGSENFFSDVISIISAYLEQYNSSHVVVSDLNWRRSLLWREASALSFDSRYARLPLEALEKICTIDISYVHGADAKTGNINQSLLYVGWLANRLHWTYKQAVHGKDDAIEITFTTAAKTEVKVNVLPVGCDQASCGNICSIELSFSDKNLPSVSMRQNAASPGVHVHFDGANGANDNASSSEAFQVNQPTEARLIDLELETCDRDPILESAFRTAAQIVDAVSKKSK